MKKLQSFCSNCISQDVLEVVNKICRFSKTQGSGDSGTTFGAVPEAAKSDTSYRILIFLFFVSFSFFLRISKNTRYRRFAVRFCCRPGGGKKRHIPYEFNNFIFCIFFIFLASFKKHKVPEILAPLLVPSQRRQKATHPI